MLGLGDNHVVNVEAREGLALQAEVVVHLALLLDGHQILTQWLYRAELVVDSIRSRGFVLSKQIFVVTACFIRGLIINRGTY